MRLRADRLTDSLLIILAMAAVAFAAVTLARLSQADPWYHNLDMDIGNAADALLVNSDQPSGLVDQPGLPMKYLLALDYRVRHRLGLQAVWNFSKFDATADPLAELPGLMAVGRSYSRALVLLFLVTVGVLVQAMTRDAGAAAVAVILSAGSSGLLFHGLLVRPELLCAWFGEVTAVLCMWQGIEARGRSSQAFWLFGAGICVGLATLTKLPGLLYLPVFFAWVILDTLEKRASGSDVRARQKSFGWPLILSSILAAGGAVGVLGLVKTLMGMSLPLDPVVVARLRIGAGAVLVGALLSWIPWRSRPGRRCRDSLRGCLLLASGGLASLPLGYLALRATMSDRSAGFWVSRALHNVLNPASEIDAYASGPHPLAEFIKFLGHDPWLFGTAFAVVILISLRGREQTTLKAASGILLALAVGMAALLARRYFIAQYVIFTQVPLLMLLALGVHAAGLHLAGTAGQNWRPWLRLMAGGAAFALVFQGAAQLKREYADYQGYSKFSDQVRWLYQTGMLPGEYRELMREHYQDVAGFERALRAMPKNAQAQ